MNELDAALERLVGRGVIDAEQAAAVLAELRPDGDHEPEQREDQPSRIRPLTEVAGYVGGALAAISALLLGAEVWDQLVPLAQSALLALATGALVAGGWWVIGNDEPAVRRLVSVLWLLAAGTAAWSVGVLSEGALDLGEETTVLLVGATLLAGGIVLYLRHRTAVQQIPVLVGLGLTGGGLLLQLPNPPDDLAGLLVWALGVAWGILAWASIVRPSRAGIVLGGIAALIGAQTLVFSAETPGLLLGLATTAIGFTFAAMLALPVVAGLSVAGMVIFLPQAVLSWFESSVAVPIALFTTGVVLLAGSLATVKLSAKREDES